MADKDALKKACDEAFNQFPNACNKSTTYVLQQLVDPNWPEKLANDMIDDIIGKKWKEVDDDTAWTLANQGVVVVAGLKAPDDGHVLVAYPGAKKQRGGFKCDGKDYPELGDPFPRAMSTSKGKWCGAHSKGEKTIRDAWSAADWPKVKHWRQP